MILLYVEWIHEKNDFIEVSKNVSKSENNVVRYQNNYLEDSSTMSNAAK